MPDKKAHWEKVYDSKSPLEVSWHQAEPTISLQLIRNTRISLDQPVIDIGGGASTLVDHLCAENYSNIGVLDISAKALSYAQERLGSRASKIEWYEEDITSFNPPHPFSVWHDRAVFHFLTEESDRKNYIKTMKQSLKPNGHLIIAAFAIGGPEKCSGLDIVQYNAEKLSAEIGKNFDLIEQISEVHVTPGNQQQNFLYFHFIKK